MDDGMISSIVKSKARIIELENLKKKVEDSVDDIRLKIETKHWRSYSYMDMSSFKEKNKLQISKQTLLRILNKMIFEEEDEINKLLEIEFERRNFETEVNRR